MRFALPASALVVLGLAFAAPASADFTVTAAGDIGDATPDGLCNSDGGACDLREAIDEANATAGLDTISFAPAFNGTLGAATINVGSLLPFVTQPLTLNGGDCDPSPVAARPCVGVNAIHNGFSFSSAVTLSLSGVAFSSSAAGNQAVNIQLGTATIRNTWFGLRVDGSSSTGACTIGLNLQDGVGGSIVGGTDPQQRNVFSDCSTGLEVHTDNNVVQGNYFGTTPGGALDGTLTSARAVDVHGQSGNAATGNQIGGPDPGTPTVCDGPCNLIAGASTAGVRLGVYGNPNSAADGTLVEGNFIGLGLDGSSDIGNGTGVTVERGDGTVIGGATTTRRNYIAGNTFGGFNAEDIPTGLLVQNNFIGLNAAGTAGVEDSSAVAVGAPAAQFIGNRLAERGLNIDGSGVIVQGNSIGIGVGGQDLGFSGTGINILGPAGDSALIGGGSAGQGNEIGNVINGIGTDGSFSNNNIIKGNRIGSDFAGSPHPVSGKGIRMQGDLNVIGGSFNEPAFTENLITSNGDDAIAIINVASNGNGVYRNRGTAGPDSGQDMFLDLGDDGPGNPGVNDNVPQLSIFGATPTLITGFSLDNPAMGDILVAVKTTDDTGRDVRSLIANTTDPNGTNGWSIPVSPAMPTGQCVMVGRINVGGGSPTFSSTEYSDVATVGGGICDVTGPTVTIAPVASPTATPSFSFTATEPGSSFECRVDSASFAPCASPHAPSLSPGAHTFQVRATDPVGNTGPVAEAAVTVTVPPTPTPTATGKRAAALKKCKKKKGKARKKCIKKAKKLPI
jgi:hypothetical protein